MKTCTERREGEESGWRGQKTKRQMGNGENHVPSLEVGGAQNRAVGRKLVKV